MWVKPFLHVKLILPRLRITSCGGKCSTYLSEIQLFNVILYIKWAIVIQDLSTA